MNKIKYDYIFLLLILLTVGILTYSKITFQVDNVRIDNEKIRSFNKGWTSTSKDGDKIKISFPFNLKMKAGESISITNEVTSDIRGETLAFLTSDEIVKVFMNGNVVYTFGSNDKKAFGKTPGTAWHFIKLPYHSLNSQITIQLSSPYSNHGSRLSGFLIGSKSACVFHIIKSNLLGFLLSAIILLFGFVHIILYIMLKKPQRYKKILRYLGWFTILMSLVSLIETKLLQLFIGNQNIFSSSVFLIYMLAPIPLLLYLGETYFYSLHKKYHMITNVFIINFVISVILQLFNLLDFMQTSHVTHILILLTCCIGFIDICKLIRVKNWNAQLIHFLSSLIVLIICVSLDMIRYYTLNRTDVAFFQRFGLLYFILTLSIQDIQKIISFMKQSSEAHNLRRIAYEDILTKCKNRFYFEEKLLEISTDLSPDSEVVIAVFDINNLKQVNDYKGHHEGDSLIIQAARLINDCFCDYTNLSRIGGDEFAFIISNMPKWQIEDSFHYFYRVMEEQNEQFGKEYDIAYGYAFYDPETDRTLQDTFTRADRNMYACKNSMKKGKMLPITKVSK